MTDEAQLKLRTGLTTGLKSLVIHVLDVQLAAGNNRTTQGTDTGADTVEYLCWWP